MFFAEKLNPMQVMYFIAGHNEILDLGFFSSAAVLTQVFCEKQRKLRSFCCSFDCMRSTKTSSGCQRFSPPFPGIGCGLFLLMVIFQSSKLFLYFKWHSEVMTYCSAIMAYTL